MFLFSTTQKTYQFRLEEIGAMGSFARILPSVEGWILALTDTELYTQTTLPEPHMERTLSRSALLLLTLLEEIESAIVTAELDRNRIGIYGSVGKGVMAARLLDRLAKTERADRMTVLLGETPPKQVFRESTYVPASQLSIFLKSRGPVSTFPHRRFGLAHALDAAAMDFAQKSIDAAIVFASSALDNPIANVDVQSRLPKTTVQKEAAAAVLLESKAEAEGLAAQVAEIAGRAIGPLFHGRAEPLLRVQQRLSQ